MMKPTLGNAAQLPLIWVGNPPVAPVSGYPLGRAQLAKPPHYQCRMPRMRRTKSYWKSKNRQRLAVLVFSTLILKELILQTARILAVSVSARAAALLYLPHLRIHFLKPLRHGKQLDIRRIRRETAHLRGHFQERARCSGRARRVRRLSARRGSIAR